MRTTISKAAATALAAMALGGCAMPVGTGAGWTTLVDGTKGLEKFDRLGEADWAAVDGAIQATKGGKDPAYLASKQSYRDFEMREAFWASDDANSGVFVVMNGQKTVDVTDSKLASGPFALQWGRGTVTFRSVRIRPL